MKETKNLLERLIKNREIRLLVKQYEEINEKLIEKFLNAEVWSTGKVLFDFDEYERVHRNAQEKLQEIAVFFYGNRDYFPIELEVQILKLLNSGFRAQKIFEETKEVYEKYEKEMA